MFKLINTKKNKKGFTLVELVVVIAILSVLAMIATTKLGSSRLTAQVAAHNANVRVLKSVGIMYLVDNPDAIYTKENESISDDLGAYFDGGKLPKRTVDVDENKIASGFVVKVQNSDIVVIPGEVEIKEEDGNKIVIEVSTGD